MMSDHRGLVHETPRPGRALAGAGLWRGALSAAASARGLCLAAATASGPPPAGRDQSRIGW
jgi:hypothetical protein